VSFDPQHLPSSKPIVYTPSGLDGFKTFVEEPIARGTGPSYWGGILTSVCCALFGWASAYNRHFLNKMPTIAVQGRPGIGKTNGL